VTRLPVLRDGLDVRFRFGGLRHERNIGAGHMCINGTFVDSNRDSG
jgi:hypothetical protein